VAAQVYFIAERKRPMIREDIIARHPLRHLGLQGDELLGEGAFGAVMARAGVGKTALLVQLALNAMVRGKRVLHVSMNDPVAKVALWYEEIFSLLAAPYPSERKALWEEILPLRFIMTFKVEGFSAATFEERLNDLIIPGIFKPDLVLIDGMSFETAPRDDLSAVKEMARAQKVRAWFTVPIHRHQETGRAGIPLPLLPVKDLFDLVLLMATEAGAIRIRVLKGPEGMGETPTLFLDPSSLLVMDEAS